MRPSNAKARAGYSRRPLGCANNRTRGFGSAGRTQRRERATTSRHAGSRTARR